MENKNIVRNNDGSMTKSYKEAILENRNMVNRRMNKILIGCWFCGPLIALGLKINWFADISYTSCFLVTLFIVLITIIQRIMISFIPNHYATALIGLWGCLPILGVMANAHMGIYMTMFLVPLLALQYSEMLIYISSCIVSFVFVVLNTYMISEYYSSLRISGTPFIWFRSMTAGYAIEYVFMFLAGLSINLINIRKAKSVYENIEILADRNAKEKELQEKLRLDTLTGMKNRFAYDEELQRLTDKGTNLEDNFTVVFLDVNGLKNVNDTIGHDAGNEMLLAVGECVEESFGKCGKCYRISGDEFVAFVETDDDTFLKLCEEFEEMTASWQGMMVTNVSASYGYCKHKEFPNREVEKLLKEADARMLAYKDKYYQREGIVRHQAYE